MTTSNRNIHADFSSASFCATPSQGSIPTSGWFVRRNCHRSRAIVRSESRKKRFHNEMRFTSETQRASAHPETLRNLSGHNRPASCLVDRQRPIGPAICAGAGRGPRGRRMAVARLLSNLGVVQGGAWSNRGERWRQRLASCDFFAITALLHTVRRCIVPSRRACD